MLAVFPQPTKTKHPVTAIFHIIVLKIFLGFFPPRLAGYIEAMASRLGLSIPDLTPKQADMWQTRLSAHVVSLCCVCFGY